MAIRPASTRPARCNRRPFLALDFEEKPLAPQWGAPLRRRVPTKLGFKSARNLEAIEATNKYPGLLGEPRL